jgi:trehalose/maltose hydrolase-like predicted phosphorylase
MSHAVLSLLYARLGDQKRATEVFARAYQPNQLPPFGVLAETAGGTNPYFATGAGGMLQAVLFGFGGLELDAENGLESVPSVLPKGWTSLTLKGIGPDKKTYTIRAE